jgi:hypothetical protein
LKELVLLGSNTHVLAPWFNEATTQALEDAHRRALIALERAKERVRQAHEEE